MEAGFRTTFRGVPAGHVAFVPRGFKLVPAGEPTSPGPAAGANLEPPSLCGLAYVCRIYDAMTDYGQSLRSFREDIKGALDLTDPGQAKRLLEWLNSWTCRIDLDYLKPIAADLAGWFKRYCKQLPNAEVHLVGASGRALAAFAEPFDRLSAIKPPGARRSLGPTAASKTLFALCPTVFVPWDAPMRGRLVGAESGTAYVDFLKRMRDDLRLLADLSLKNGFALQALPEKIGRPDSTPAQLIGEYYWVTITRGVTPPDSATLQSWAAWS
jgi:hypothetical protein